MKNEDMIVEGGALSCFFAIRSSFACAAQTFPKPTGRVNDFANVIDPAAEAEIDRQLDQLEQQDLL